MAWRRTVMPDLPGLNVESNGALVRSVLKHTHSLLTDEFQSTIGPEREAVREQLRRFREETLAGVMAGPHIPTKDDADAAFVRSTASMLDVLVAATLSEP